MLYPPDTPLRLTEVRRFACACLQSLDCQTHFTDHACPHPPAPSDASIDANGECARAGRVAVGCCDGDGALGWPRAASRGHVVFSGGLRGLNTVPATAVRPSRGARSRPASSGGCLRLPACSPAWRVVPAGDSVNMCVAHGLAPERCLQMLFFAFARGLCCSHCVHCDL